jgi:hypothetical protein
LNYFLIKKTTFFSRKSDSEISKRVKEEKNLWKYFPCCNYLSCGALVYIHMYIHVCKFTYIQVYMSTCLRVYMSTCLHVYIRVYMSTYVSTCLHTCLHVYIRVYMSAYVSTYMSTMRCTCLPTWLTNRFLLPFADIELKLDHRFETRPASFLQWSVQ